MVSYVRKRRKPGDEDAPRCNSIMVTTPEGERMDVGTLARRTGVSYFTLRKRVLAGRPFSRLFDPPRKGLRVVQP